MLLASEMQALEEAAFARGIKAEDLMLQAAIGLAAILEQQSSKPAKLILVLGKGNNAGDALFAAQLLHKKGWSVALRLAYDATAFKPLPKQCYEANRHVFEQLDSLQECVDWGGELWVLDALLGIGAKGAPRQEVLQCLQEIDMLRKQRPLRVLALDGPSGLDLETGQIHACTVAADITVCFGRYKAQLLQDAATDYVGSLRCVPLRGLEPETELTIQVASAVTLAPHLPRRRFDFHKGMAGRVAIIAGSRGMLGAAEMTALGALHGGAGLVTLYAKRDIADILAVRLPAEVMLKPVRQYGECLQDRWDVLVAGPGLSEKLGDEVLSFLPHVQKPMLLDAELLNALARQGLHYLERLNASVLLTPHPGEFARLLNAECVPSSSNASRMTQIEDWVNRHQQCLLLKGARTLVQKSGSKLWINSSGHAGMASGGMGDVLAGLCGALMAQGLEQDVAGIMGSWLMGRAAECRINAQEDSTETLSATRVLAALPMAFRDLRELRM